jgi:hypothetical protein
LDPGYKKTPDPGSATLLLSYIYFLIGVLLSSVLDHLIWSSTENVTRLERIISGLGSLPAHGPPLLAWTLATYLARGAEGLEKTARLG